MASVSVSGTKVEAKQQIAQQVSTQAGRNALNALVDRVAGKNVSLSGTLPDNNNVSGITVKSWNDGSEPVDHSELERERAKHQFSVSLSGTKEVATQQIAEQVLDSALGGALAAIVAAAPGDSVSLAGTMESSDDGSKGKLTITGIFKTAPLSDADAAEEQRKAASRREVDYAYTVQRNEDGTGTLRPAHTTVRGQEVGASATQPARFDPRTGEQI